MKLVSYYEDKYKVVDHEPTERGTKTPVLSENNILGSENKDIARIGFETKNVKSVSYFTIYGIGMNNWMFDSTSYFNNLNVKFCFQVMNIMDVPEVVIA